MKHGRKAFHFDLDVNKLREVYPSEHPTAYNVAWSKIKAFMESNGFEHSQYSGYVSVRDIDYDRAYQLIDKLCDTYPWFGECVQAVALTEIGERHNVLSYLRSQDRQAGPAAPRKGQSKRSPSLADEAKDAKRASKELEDDRGDGGFHDKER